ncbi:2OG-Fe(II) oxygenase [Microbulbifer sp. YPW16]|uniref:2OG-Fe(II) oxygenase n=1 Tax=Microbulbifer sp. YPW16 TaxID=2904242 RepID=UPI001E62C080|nr:2OG-Fe(II) oxygenase [Microbulbifer sp. YPW16]UHQ54104.1 2OG-Fe(II) oxygenase [Microbulbifer sp. YPW16]
MKEFTYQDYLPNEQLKTLVRESAEDYRSALPFAHGVYDDVFSPEVLNAVLEEFERGQKYWREFNSKYEKKFQMSSDLSMGPVTRTFIHTLNSAPFLEFLEQLTGIQGLIPDPYLHGAGLHKIPAGGKLGVHVDFNGHRRMNVYRRINVLIYLNKDWLEEWGGNFELWCAREKVCKKSIAPIFNRMAIFSTTAKSFHGHPHPLSCPEDRHRVSLALYYYTAGERGEQKKDLHSTIFLRADGKQEELSRQPKGLVARIRRALVNRLVSNNEQAKHAG